MSPNFHAQVDQAAESGDLPGLLKLMAQLIHDMDPEKKQNERDALQIQRAKETFEAANTLPQSAPIHMNCILDPAGLVSLLQQVNAYDLLVTHIILHPSRFVYLLQTCSQILDPETSLALIREGIGGVVYGVTLLLNKNTSPNTILFIGEAGGKVEKVQPFILD